MRKIRTIRGLDEFGRVQLSEHFRMRDFLYSDISNFYSIPNIPSDPNLAINAGRALCEHLLEPLKKKFGEILIRSAFRSEAVNDFGNKNGLNCASNQRNHARHIWDRRDKDGNMGATACISIPWFSSRLSDDVDWRQLAWWIHDHLPYNEMVFFPRNAALNLNWRENPQRRIDSYARPRGCLTKPGMPGRENQHPERYPLISRGLDPVT